MPLLSNSWKIKSSSWLHQKYYFNSKLAPYSLILYLSTKSETISDGRVLMGRVGKYFFILYFDILNDFALRHRYFPNVTESCLYLIKMDESISYTGYPSKANLSSHSSDAKSPLFCWFSF